MKNQLRIYVNDQELSMLNELIEKKGFRLQDIFRKGLRDVHLEFLPPTPPYIIPRKSKEKPVISKEDKCIQGGGEIVMRGEVKKCIITRGGIVMESTI